MGPYHFLCPYLSISKDLDTLSQVTHLPLLYIMGFSKRMPKVMIPLVECSSHAIGGAISLCHWKFIFLEIVGDKRMKILVIMDILILILWFYGYIWDISTNILEKNINRSKIDQNSWKYIKINNIIRSIINILKLFC